MNARSKPPPNEPPRFHFRSPSPQEETLRLWVDRIGEGSSTRAPRGYRILGQFALVASEDHALTLSVEGAEPVEAAPGDAIYVFPESPTSYGTHESWHSIWIVWDGDEARDLVEVGALPTGACVIQGAGDAVRAAHASLARLIRREDVGGAVARKVIMLRLVRELLRVAEKNRTASRNEKLIEDTIAYVRDNYRAELRVPALAERCGLSESHFRRVFKKHTGRSPLAFIASERIARSKDLLARGHSIADTAARTGFRDQFQFMKAFRRVEGTTAGDFARRNKS